MILQYQHLISGLTALTHVDEQSEAAVLVDHDEEREPQPDWGGIEIEIDGPHQVVMLGLMTPHRAVN